MITYKPIHLFKPDLIQKLIKQCYADLLQFFPNEKQNFYEQWEREDEEAFNNPNTIGKYVLFTCIDDTPIGYFCWGEHKFPKGIIGQNCILPNYQNQGYGKKQLELMIKIFKGAKFREVSAITGDHKFFIPAQKMYKNSGFKEKRKLNGDLFERIEFFRLL